MCPGRLLTSLKTSCDWGFREGGEGGEGGVESRTFHYPLYAEKTRLGPKAAARPVSNSEARG
jgi:hypothetical protein